MVTKKKYTLKQLRGLSGLTQKDFASKVGVSEQTFADYENKPGRLRSARVDTFERIVEVLGEELDMPIESGDIFLDPTRVKPE